MSNLGFATSAKIAIAIAVVVVALIAGFGGYHLAASKGVDVDAAQQAATHAGERRGHAIAARHAYARGFKATRRHAYEAAYRKAYGSAYRAEFDEAGLAAPETVKVSGP